MPPPVQTGRAVLRAVRREPAPREPMTAGPYAVGVAGALALVFFGLIAYAGRDLHPPAQRAPDSPPPLVTAAFVPAPASLHVHDLQLDLLPAPGTSTISWEGARKHEPVFRMGRDAADSALEVAAKGGRFEVVLPELTPGWSYVYRISGWPGGGAYEGRFTAPPGESAAVRTRVQMLDLPDGAALQAATFGRPRLARPLWARESASAGEVLASGRCVVIHDGRHVLALDPTEGSVRWTHPAAHPAPVPRPVMVAGLVVVATPEGPLALDLETGRPRWRLPLPSLRALHAAADELYVHLAGPPARLHRVQATDGRIISILPMPEVPHDVQLGEQHALIRIEEPADARGEMLLRGVERLRGEQRWERLMFGAELPVLRPVVSGDRLHVALAGRVEARSMGTGAVLASWALTEPPLLTVPVPEGGVLVCTGGPVPRAHLLDADLKLRRAWVLPGAPISGAIAGERAVLTDAEGVQILELTAGPRWAITGWPPARRVALTAEGHLFAQLPPGSPWADRLIALALR